MRYGAPVAPNVLAFASALTLVSAAGAQQIPAAQLRNALRIADPDVRRATADALAKRDGLTVDDWLTALAAWKSEPELEPGMHVITEPLWNGEKTEETELHVYVPKRALENAPAPVLHSAHGTGGSGTWAVGMWRGIADRLGMIVIAPSESGPNDGYHFHVREREIAKSAIRWARLNFDVDENRVYLTGVSRGGHMTWDLALRYPDLSAAVAPMIGGPRWNPNGQNNLRFLENVTSLPIRDLQGMKDDARMILNLRIAFERLEKLKAKDAKLIEFPELGHSFELGAVEWDEFWAKTRNPRPDRVVRMMSTPGEGRAFWVEILAVDKKKVRDRFKPAMPTSLYNRLDDAGRRRWICDKAEKATARLEVSQTAPGKFRAKARHVSRFRLLLTDDMLPEKGRVEVRYGARRPTFKFQRSKKVLLREFVERIDRNFLPVVEVIVK